MIENAFRDRRGRGEGSSEEGGMREPGTGRQGLSTNPEWDVQR